MSRTIRRKKGYKWWLNKSRYHDRFFIPGTDYKEKIKQTMKQDKIEYESDNGHSECLTGSLKKLSNSKSRAAKKEELSHINKISDFEDIYYDSSEERKKLKQIIMDFY